MLMALKEAPKTEALAKGERVESRLPGIIEEPKGSRCWVLGGLLWVLSWDGVLGEADRVSSSSPVEAGRFLACGGTNILPKSRLPPCKGLGI